MLFLSFLRSDFPFFASAVFVFGGFNDVGETRFGGIAGILFELGDFHFEHGNFISLLFDENCLFQCQFCPIKGFLFSRKSLQCVRIT